MASARESTAVQTLSRRLVLKGFGAGVVALGSGAALLGPRRAFGQAAEPRSKPNTPVAPTASATPIAPPCSSGQQSSEPSPWWLLAPLAAGAKIDNATVLELGWENGILNVDLDRGGKKLRIRVCKHDASTGAPNPVARTERYDFFLANGGKGHKPTDEGEGSVVTAVAAVAKKNETSRAALPLLDVREYWRRCGG